MNLVVNNDTGFANIFVTVFEAKKVSLANGRARVEMGYFVSISHDQPRSIRDPLVDPDKSLVSLTLLQRLAAKKADRFRNTVLIYSMELNTVWIEDRIFVNHTLGIDTGRDTQLYLTTYMA